MPTLAQQTSTSLWLPPTVVIPAVVAVVGWFVAYMFRVREVAHQNRRETYAKVLGPTAELLGMLQDTGDMKSAIAKPAQQDEYAKCLVRLNAGVGEVDLIRKSKVSWAAVNLRDALAKYKESDTRPVDDTSLKRATRARDDFLLVAGRSLESLPVRWVRDHHKKDKERADRVGWVRAQTKKQRHDSDTQRQRKLDETGT